MRFSELTDNEYAVLTSPFNVSYSDGDTWWTFSRSKRVIVTQSEDGTYRGYTYDTEEAFITHLAVLVGGLA